MSPTVLLVEDDPVLRSAYDTILKAEGFKVMVANDGWQGLEIARKEPVHTIILDMLMPNISGLEFLRSFKPYDHPDTFFLVLSNVADSEEIRQAKDLGASMYLVKSDYSPKEVVNLIKANLPGEKDGTNTHS